MVVEIARWIIVGALAVSLLLAAGSWAVTTRRLNPFGAVARAIRALADPLLNPVERVLLRRGGNPQQAPWWLVGIVIIGGILLLAVLQFVVGMALTVRHAISGGPREILRLAVITVGNVLMVALVVRVVGSWLGAGRYNRWTRWSWPLTDWLVVPIQRLLPPFGPFDFSPLVAWLAIWLGMGLLLGML